MSASSDTFENLFLGGEQNFLGLPMRFARDDARGIHRFTQKAATDLCIGAREPRSARDGLEPTFARVPQPLDFQLFQQYPPAPDLPSWTLLTRLGDQWYRPFVQLNLNR